MTVAFGTIGVANVGTTSLSVAYPASISAGDLLILAITNKYPTNAPTTPTDWTAPSNNQAFTEGGDPGAGVGDLYTTVFTKVATGSESGSLSVTVTSGNVSIGVMWRVTKTLATFSTVCAFGTDDTGGAAISCTGNVDPGLQAGDLLFVAMGANIGNRTYSAQAVTATGISAWGAVVEHVETVSTTGDDASLVITEHPVTTGTSSAAPVFVATASGGTPEAGAVFIRVRDVSAGDVTMSAAAATATASSPVAAVSAGAQIDAAAATATVTSPAAALTGGAVMAAGAATATAASPVSTLTGEAGGGATLAGQAATATVAAPAATYLWGQTLSGEPATATVLAPSAAVTGGALMTGATGTAAAVAPSASIEAGAVIVAQAATATALSPAAAYLWSQLLAAQLATATATSPAATLIGLGAGGAAIHAVASDAAYGGASASDQLVGSASASDSEG